MNKWLIGLIALYLMGDPGLVYLESMGGMKEMFIVLMLSLAVVPWVVSHFDN
jgi:hypothetical protein